MGRIKEKYIKRIFFVALLSSLFLLLVSIPLTHYDSLRLYLWKQGSSFYDFFTGLKGNIYWNRAKLYSDGAIYPPLANFFYALITRCMSIETLKKMEELTNYSKIKALQECSIYFVLYMNILLLFYYLICIEWKKGTKLEKNVFAIAMLFTIPFLYQFERANIVFLALLFTMMFFLWKDSENKILRELSYISLAVASGIKIYPALFGLLILREKKYKDVLRLLVYGIAAFVVPFVFYGGFQNVLVMLNNIRETSANFSMTRIGYQLDYLSTIKYFFAFTGSNCVFLGKVIQILFALLGLWAMFGLRQKWKAVLLLTCMVIGIPSISYVYTAIFMIIPIIMYLDSGDKSIKDLIYLGGMLLVMIPLPFCWQEGAGDVYYSYMHISTPVFVEGLSITVMTFLLICEGFFLLLKNRKIRLESIVALILSILLAVGVNKASYNAPFAYIDYLSKTLSNYIDVSDGAQIVQSFTANNEFLNYIVLRFNPADSGELQVTVKQENNDCILITQSFNMSEFDKGYNQLMLDGCKMISGTQYILEIAVECESDESVRFWRTIDYLDTGIEYFKVNDEMLNGALGIQFYESKNK